MLAAGRLNRRITIRRATQAQDDKGGYIESWMTVASVWAEVLGIDGREAVIAQALQGVSYFKITVRWRPGIQASDQILLDDGRTLNIRSVADPTGRRVMLVLLADTASVQSED